MCHGRRRIDGVRLRIFVGNGRLSEQLKSARCQLDTLNDEKEHLQERYHIIVEQTRRDLAVKHAECQEYKAKVHRALELFNKTSNVNVKFNGYMTH